MKRVGALCLAGLLLALAAAACGPGPMFGTEIRGSGDVLEEEREIQDVRGVELAMQGTLAISFGAEERLEIVADDNLLEYIEADVFAGTLQIGTPVGVNLRETRPIEFRLTVPELDTLETSSSGSILAPGLESDRCRLAVSSSGRIETGPVRCGSVAVEVSSSGGIVLQSLQADSLDVRISSSGEVSIGGGEARSQTVTVTSSGDYNAPELESDEAHVRISSSGAVKIRVHDHLTAELSSSGNVYVYGKPDVDAHTSSSGYVIQVGD